MPQGFPAEVPEYLAPAQEQGAIIIGVTGYPGREFHRMLAEMRAAKLHRCLGRCGKVFMGQRSETRLVSERPRVRRDLRGWPYHGSSACRNRYKMNLGWQQLT